MTARSQSLSVSQWSPVAAIADRGRRGHRPRPTACSALRELEARAGFPVAVLLALHDAGVAGEEPFLLQRGAQIGLKVGQRLGKSVADRAGLPRKAAAG